MDSLKAVRMKCLFQRIQRRTTLLKEYKMTVMKSEMLKPSLLAGMHAGVCTYTYKTMKRESRMKHWTKRFIACTLYLWQWGLSNYFGEWWTTFSWKGSQMEVNEGKFGAISASVQHSSAPVYHYGWWWSHVFVHFHLEGHCRENYSWDFGFTKTFQ